MKKLKKKNLHSLKKKTGVKKNVRLGLFFFPTKKKMGRLTKKRQKTEKKNLHSLKKKTGVRKTKCKSFENKKKA